MKTTVKIPDALYHDAKASAAQAGIPMRRRETGPPGAPPWMTAFGGLSELHRENRRLDRLIAKEFERIDEGDWR